MHFQYLSPLFLLILIPIIILMYLLKQKAKDTKISSLFLWKEMYRNRESDTPWEKLKKNKLLIIQLITVLVLIFVLMSPYHSTIKKPGSSVVILIDNSGSMATIMSNKKTRLDYAKNAAKEYVKTLPDDTQITVISCSMRTSTLISNSLNKNAVISAINGVDQTTLSGDCTSGITLCEKMRTADSNLSVTAFTDSPLSFGALNGMIYSFSSVSENASVDYIGTSAKSDAKMILVSVTNHGTKKYVGDVNLYGDDKLLAIMNAEVEAGETEVIYFEGLDFKGTYLKAELNEPDTLEYDNVYYALNNASNKRKILLITEKNLYLKKAIELNSNVTLHETNDPETFSGLDSEDYDLYIYDGDKMLPSEFPKTGNLLFINCCDDRFFTTTETFENRFLALEESPYTESISGYNFGVVKTLALEQPVWAKSFISADRYSAGFIGDTNERKVGFIGFDLHLSDFPLDYRFPILTWNMISDLADTASLSDTFLFCGEAVKINNLDSGKNFVSTPRGKKEELSSGAAIFTSTTEPGIYTLNPGTDHAESFVVNFDIDESTAHSAPTTVAFSGDNVAIVDATTTNNYNYRTILIILLLIIMAIEWIVYIKD